MKTTILTLLCGGKRFIEILIQFLRYLYSKRRSRSKITKDQIFSDVYTRGHSTDWCPRQTPLRRTDSLLLSLSIVSSPCLFRHYLDLLSRASEIRLRLISPGGEKKRAFFAQNTSLQRSIPFELNNPRRWSSMNGKREKKRRRWIWSWEWQIRFRIFPIAATSGK